MACGILFYREWIWLSEHLPTQHIFTEHYSVLGSVSGIGDRMVKKIQLLPIKWEVQTLRSTILYEARCAMTCI